MYEKNDLVIKKNMTEVQKKNVFRVQKCDNDIVIWNL